MHVTLGKARPSVWVGLQRPRRPHRHVCSYDGLPPAHSCLSCEVSSGSPVNREVNLRWIVNGWDVGTTEPGSSGSPLFGDQPMRKLTLPYSDSSLGCANQMDNAFHGYMGTLTRCHMMCSARPCIMCRWAMRSHSKDADGRDPLTSWYCSGASLERCLPLRRWKGIDQRMPVYQQKPMLPPSYRRRWFVGGRDRHSERGLRNVPGKHRVRQLREAEQGVAARAGRGSAGLEQEWRAWGGARRRGSDKHDRGLGARDGCGGEQRSLGHGELIGCDGRYLRVDRGSRLVIWT